MTEIVEEPKPVFRIAASTCQNSAMSTSTAMEPKKTRSVPAVVTAVAFLVAGSVFLGAGMVALWAHISVQIMFDPFHRVMSVFLTTFELGGMLLIVGTWLLWTGHLLLHRKRSGYRSGTGILAVVFLRGALSLLPPLQKDELMFGIAFMLLGVMGVVLLSYARPALNGK